MTHDVMRHRLVLSFEALSDDVSADQILATIVEPDPRPRRPPPGPSGIRVGA